MHFAETMKVDEKPLTLPIRFDIMDMLGSVYPDFLLYEAFNLDKQSSFEYNITILLNR